MENKLTGYPSVDKPWLKYYSEEAIRAQVSYQKTVDFMIEQNERNTLSTALNYFGKKTSYGALFAQINQAALSFQNLGVKEGDIVSFCVPTLPEAIVAFYALNKIGAIAAMINPITNSERIIDFIKMFKSKLFVAIDLFAPKLDGIFSATDIEQCVIISATDSLSSLLKVGYKIKNLRQTKRITRTLAELNEKIISWDSFFALGRKGRLVLSDYHPNAPAGIVLTSGTTGIPKGAVLTNENLNAVALEQRYCTNMEKNDTFLNIMPPFLAYGLVCGISNVLCNGLEMFIIPKFEKRIEEDIRRQLGKNESQNIAPLDRSNMLDTLLVKLKPQHILGVPNFFLNLTQSPKMKSFDLSFLKSVIAGGDVLHESTENAINDFLSNHGFLSKLSKGYGMTELSSVATYTTTQINKLGSVGIPVMLNNVRIVDIDSGEDLGYNQKGELYVSGPGVIWGYYNNEQETATTFVIDEHGVKWVKTGDVFTIDEDGALFFMGRLKRMMVRPDGHNVFPSPIEKVISSFREVEDCAVVGAKVKEGPGEIPTAVIQLSKACTKTKSEIKEAIMKKSFEELPENDVALAYMFIDKIPYTFVGKVDFRELERLAQDTIT